MVDTLPGSLRRLCVFCGSSRGAQPAYARAAAELGRALAREGIELVYGGSHLGLMGVIADAALAAGGRVIGVIPDFMLEREIGHRQLSELRVVRSMHERKANMAELSDAFVALPGGFGTFEELCEMLTWGQLGLHAKPCALYDVEGYYQPMLQLFDRAVEQGFVRAENRSSLLVEREPAALLARLRAYSPTPSRTRIAREQT